MENNRFRTLALDSSVFYIKDDSYMLIVLYIKGDSYMLIGDGPNKGKLMNNYTSLTFHQTSLN